MSGKRTKLKKIELTSVDMVRRGANQEAYINLYKSDGDPNNPAAPPDAPESPNKGEIPQGLWKSIVEAVKSFMGQGEGNVIVPKEQEEVEKAADTFADRIAQQEIRDNRLKYQDALNMSIYSILNDDMLSDEEKISMIDTSVNQFADAYKEMCAKLVKTTANIAAKKVEPKEVGKSQELSPDKTEEGEREMKIDKSRFTPEELAQYEALINKGKIEEDDFVPEVDDEEDDMEDGMEDGEDVEMEKKGCKKKVGCKKSEYLHPEVKKALEEMESLKKSIEMKELAGIAKKYAPLGKKEDELAETLYNMKKSSQETYDAYVSVLDQNLELVNKSGIFSEIGKSGRGLAGATVEDKIHNIAKSYTEKDPEMDYTTALLKAWENNPHLMDEYDEEY